MKKIKSNNKGFSLIELIIVIAIMAVLVAIIAPNLTKYLGTSKTQTDKKNMDEAKAQIKNCIADATTQDIAVSTWTAQDLTLIAVSQNSFDKLVKTALDGASLTSKADSSKKIWAKITANSDGTYEVKVAISQNTPGASDWK